MTAARASTDEPVGAMAPPKIEVSKSARGCRRKMRWSSEGQGKRGGARVIYFLAQSETIWLLVVYKNAKFDNLPTAFLAELKQGVEGAL